MLKFIFCEIKFHNYKNNKKNETVDLKDLRCGDLQSNSNYLIFFTMDDFIEGSNANTIDFWNKFLI